MLSYSQQGEDICVYKNYINRVAPDGVYVEVGALDGVTYSNTKFLEDTLGFRGVLVEPTPVQFERLRANRGNNMLVNKAIAKENGTVTFLGDWATAGIADTMADNFRNQHHSNGNEYTVPSIRLEDVLHENDIKYVDFMSIDVEGGELSVLESMDWSIPVYVIVIELDDHNPDKDAKCRDILRANGFTFKIRIGNNDFFVNDDYPRKEKLYDETKPPITEIQCAFLERHIQPEVEKMMMS